MNYQELLIDASKQLKSYKFNSAKLDAELILSKTFSKRNRYLFKRK